MKKIRCKYCKRKIDMEKLEGDWQYKFYKCPHCERETPKRTFLGKTVRVGTYALYPIFIFFGEPPPE